MKNFLPPEAPELAFVLACCRAPYNSAASHRAAALLSGPLDWPAILELSRYHGLVPNLNRAFQLPCLSAAPPDVRATVESEARASAARGRFLTGELFRILDALRAANIPALPLKGPVLAQLLYGDPGGRDLADLDVLVPRTHAIRAIQTALSLGYAPPWDSSPHFLDHILQHGCEYEMVDSRTGHLLEIHWATQPDGGIEPIEIDRAFDATINVEICGRSVPFFKPETLFLFLCGHGAKHLWSPLKNLADFARFLDLYPDLDWVQVPRIAKRTRALRVVLFSLLILKDLLKIDLPGPLQQILSSGPSLSRLRPLPGILLRETRGATAFEQLQSRLVLGEGWRPALKMLFVVTPADWRSLPGKKRPYWVYLLWRPIRLIAKYA